MLLPEKKFLADYCMSLLVSSNNVKNLFKYQKKKKKKREEEGFVHLPPGKNINVNNWILEMMV